MPAGYPPVRDSELQTLHPPMLRYGRVRELACRGRDGRVAEGARLESVFRGNSNVGSNPTLSAMFLANSLIPDINLTRTIREGMSSRCLERYEIAEALLRRDFVVQCESVSFADRKLLPGGAFQTGLSRAVVCLREEWVVLRGPRPFYPGDAPRPMAICRKAARKGNDRGK